MGAEWPAGAALAMESWPPRSRGLMSGVLQGSWSLGFVLSSLAYALLYDSIGWRGLLWLGILPALAVVWVRKYVREPEVWVENRRRQRGIRQGAHAAVCHLQAEGAVGNTLTACWWMASGFVVYYSIWSLFAVHLQRDLHLGALMVGAPLIVANLVAFLASGFWGWLADIIGRRWSMMIPAFIGLFVTPVYLLSSDPLWIMLGLIRRASSPGRSMGRTRVIWLSVSRPRCVRPPAVFATTRGRSGAGSWRRS